MKPFSNSRILDILTVATPAAALMSAGLTIDQNSSPPNLSTLPASSLFSIWRPKAHVLPPSGSIGDPCMEYPDPATGLFHLGWLRGGAAGATTDDLVHYQDINSGNPFIVAKGKNDPLAVFDGSVIPSGLGGNPTLLYTSVSYLPIQWTINYTRGSETQSLAVTTDGGQNFTKLQQGPVIPGPPLAVNVTGFRDPYVFQNSQLDQALDSNNNTWYVIISGGVHGEGPAQFLYRQRDPEFQYWDFLGQWWHEPANSTWGDGDWAGRWGFNWEVGNLFSLDTEGYNQNGSIFTTHGAEWSVTPIVPQVSDFKDMLWASGDIVIETGDIKFMPNMAGKLDWGFQSYAAAGKMLPSSTKASQKSGAPDRFISYINLGSFGLTTQQNWSSVLTMPRELSLGKINNVVDNDLSRETGSWRVANSSNGVLQLETMKQVISRETLAAITMANSSFTEPGCTLSQSGTKAFNQSPTSNFFAMTASLSFQEEARDSDIKSGFQILASDNEHTNVYYQFSNESIIIDRSNSSSAALTTQGIPTSVEAGRLRLFDIMKNQTQQIEPLNVTIVVDGGMLEVHANDRFGLTTWALPWYKNSTGISFLQEGDGGVTFSDIKIYQGLFDAWPDRS